jgi:hypothetical protein
MSYSCQTTKTASPQAKPKASSSSIAKPAAPPVVASVRYTGPASVVTVGPVSGRQYRFSRTGATVQIDARDKAALMRIPHLRQV